MSLVVTNVTHQNDLRNPLDGEALILEATR